MRSHGSLPHQVKEWGGGSLEKGDMISGFAESRSGFHDAGHAGQMLAANHCLFFGFPGKYLAVVQVYFHSMAIFIDVLCHLPYSNKVIILSWEVCTFK